MEKKEETFIYEGLGFPVELIDTPMKKVFGEWVIDIDMDALQELVFQGLIHKHSPLTGKEMRFIRKFLRKTTTELGERLGVSHATIVKWEKEEAKIAPMQEAYMRMFFFGCWQEKMLLDIYKEIKPEMLAGAKNEIYTPLQVDAKQLKIA